MSSSSQFSQSAYYSFLLAYEKNPTRQFDEERCAAFGQSDRWVNNRQNELDASSATYKVATNHFSDWFSDEVARMFPVFNHSTARTMGKNTLKSAAPPEATGESFDTALNWATDENPRGRSVVPGPRNQGMCGACWAFVSAGSAEGAVNIATGSSIALSVQELIDCATEFNRGCGGGNPTFAYDYIESNGLSLWSEYPYDDTQNPKCESTTGYTKAVINYDLEIPPDDEVELKWYVSKGPVAIGLCAQDMDFMYYGGGIFNPTTCCSTQNHAVLIVGYGFDVPTNTPYWTVQNSWGDIWGGNGYMRVKRSTVRGAGPGVCGLATFPTMAIGGHILKGNISASAGTETTIGEWLLDHNEQIVSVFAAACFLLSVALLILSYWFSCRRRDVQRKVREVAASRIKIDVIRFDCVT